MHTSGSKIRSDPHEVTCAQDCPAKTSAPQRGRERYATIASQQSLVGASLDANGRESATGPISMEPIELATQAQDATLPQTSKSRMKSLFGFGTKKKARKSSQARVPPKFFKAASYVAVTGENGKLIFAHDNIDQVPPVYQTLAQQVVEQAVDVEAGRQYSVVVKQETQDDITVQVHRINSTVEGLCMCV
jgi:hypothetical protein